MNLMGGYMLRLISYGATVVGLSLAVCLWLILIFNSYPHVTKTLDLKSEVSSYQKKVVDGVHLITANKNHEW